MSVTLTEMARHNHAAQSSVTSKKRKHTEVRTDGEKQKKQKQNHLEVEDDAEVRETPKRKKKRKEPPQEDAPESAAIHQSRPALVEVQDEEERAAPPAEKSSTIRKSKKKRKDIFEVQPSSPVAATPEQQNINVPDAENEHFISSSPFIQSNTTAQLAPPSDSAEDSPFHNTRASLYVPCPAISLSTALPSLTATHLTPLLLTYFAPLDGIVLSISDPSLSSKAASLPGAPLELPTSATSSAPLALCADEDGVSYTWLTFTATIFRPTLGSYLSGYINVASEGFIGLVLYNYFQVGIAKHRIPRSWQWSAAGIFSSSCSSKKQPKKGRIRDVESDASPQNKISQESRLSSGSTAVVLNSQPPSVDPYSQITDSASRLQNTGIGTGTGMSTGHWTSTAGKPVKESDPLSFRVVDIDIVPSSSSNTRASEKMSLQIEGTLLDDDEEMRILAEERRRFERAQNKAHGRTNSPGSRVDALV